MEYLRKKMNKTIVKIKEFFPEDKDSIMKYYFSSLSIYQFRFLVKQYFWDLLLFNYPISPYDSFIK